MIMSKLHEQNIYQSISRAINVMGYDGNAVGELLAHDHPTLQQDFMRIVVGFIKTQAEKDYFDLRNEATGKVCKKLNEVLTDEEYFPHV